MAPSPTAEPVAARIKPTFEPQRARSMKYLGYPIARRLRKRNHDAFLVGGPFGQALIPGLQIGQIGTFDGHAEPCVGNAAKRDIARTQRVARQLWLEGQGLVTNGQHALNTLEPPFRRGLLASGRGE